MPSVETHSIKGEDPLSEMRRHGLGEEPTPAVSHSRNFSGRKLEDIYVLELFAGTARLTKSMKQKGFQAMAFDKSSKGLKVKLSLRLTCPIRMKSSLSFPLFN